MAVENRHARERDDSRQVLYRGPRLDIDLLVSPRPAQGGVGLRGRVTAMVGAPIAGGAVEIWSTGDVSTESPVARIALDPTGAFTFAHVPSGSYLLRFHLEHERVDVADVTL